MRWAFRDADLNFATTIPNLVIDANPNDRPASELEARMLHKLENLTTRWKLNLRIYDSVEGSEAESLHSNITINHSENDDDNDYMKKIYWRACNAPRRPDRPALTSSSSSSVSSSASFEPGSSINNTVSSYSYNSTSPSSISTGSRSNSNDSHSSSTLGHNNTTVRYTHPLPTLYGIIISHTVVAIVAYDPNSTATYSSLSPSSPTFISLPHDPSSASASVAKSTSLIPPCLRTISFFDLGDGKYDVWNALALAIIIVHCRNALLDLSHDGVLLDDVGPVKGASNDVDEDEEMDLM